MTATREETAEALVIELANWCGYETSGCARPETVAKIQTIRLRLEQKAAVEQVNPGAYDITVTIKGS